MMNGIRFWQIDIEKLAEAENNVIFGGRLAEYKYYDMGPIVEKVMILTKEWK